MPSTKVIGATIGLTTSIGGIGGGIAYSLGAFHPSIQVNKLIEKESKHKLLTSTSTAEEWKEAWNKYKTTSPWGKFTPAGEEAPQTFKDKCGKKAKGSVYSANDKEYEEIIKYCARDKTINDVLIDQNFELLNTGSEVSEWEKRFDEYKKPNNKLKLPKVEIAEGDTGSKNHSKLSIGCKNAINTKVTDKEYDNITAAIKQWCKAKG